MTKIIKIDQQEPDKTALKEAANIIKAGGTAIFPTETVYGIGVSAFNENAVKKLFKIKSRPKDQAFQVLVSDFEQVKMLSEKISGPALKILKEHWPGPLTAVVKKSGSVDSVISGGKDTVGIRMPDHAAALSLIKEAETPLAATSANKHGNPAPITAEQAARELPEADIILDGGECQIGVASTVVDLTSDPPKVLRQGSLKIET